MEISDIRRGLGLENIDLEDIDRIKFQLQQINDTIEGGLRSANLKEYRNTYVINAQDSLDATYPMYVHFNIISEMTRIVSIKLSFWFLNFRAYSTGATSGGGSAPTTSDGGSATPTTSDGGGQTSSYVTTPSGGGTTKTSSSKTTPSGGGQSSTSVSHSHTGQSTWPGGTHGHGWGSQWTSTSSTLGHWHHYYKFVLISTGGVHSHTLSISSSGSHSHYVYDHTHPSHSHTVTFPNHTHPTHAHTVSDHHHTVTIANHNHTVTIADHTHDIVYGIYEEENSPTIMPSISRDNGLTYSLPIGSYTKDHENLDITRFIDKAGSKMIKFTSTTKTRLSVQIEIKLDIKAR